MARATTCPLRTSPAAAFTRWDVMWLAVPIWSSGPHRPQLPYRSMNSSRMSFSVSTDMSALHLSVRSELDEELERLRVAHRARVDRLLDGNSGKDAFHWHLQLLVVQRAGDRRDREHRVRQVPRRQLLADRPADPVHERVLQLQSVAQHDEEWHPAVTAE